MAFEDSGWHVNKRMSLLTAPELQAQESIGSIGKFNLVNRRYK